MHRLPFRPVAIQPFRFLHTGDLHLDSPFSGLVGEAPEQVASALRSATLSAWDRIVELAVGERIDFVVVAGDVFEHANRTLLAQVRFRDGLARLGNLGIASYVVTGNHDPLSGWEPSVDWPASVHRFGADEVGECRVMRDGVEIARVYGISYPRRDVSENLALRFRRSPDAPFAVGLLHANVGSQPGHYPYAPCSMSDLRASGIDYWALGHVHRPAILSPEAPTVVYCGNPQGRDPGEADPRGCWIVDVHASGRATPHFHPADVVRWRLVELPVEGIEGEEALIEAVVGAVESAQADAGRSIVARVTLTGRAPLHRALRRAGLRDELRQLAQERLPLTTPFTWIESLRDATRPSVDVASVGAPGTFLGELLDESAHARELVRAADETEADADGEEQMALIDWEERLDPLYSHARAGRVLRGSRPSPDRLAELLEEAERRVVDRLVDSG